MFKKVQIFFVLLIVSSQSLSAMSYDSDILNMFAKLSPRIVLMSSTKERLKDSLEICLLYDESDEQSASVFEDKILSNYKNGIRNYSIDIKKVRYSELNSCAQSHMLFLFTTGQMQIKKSVALAKEKKILTISYDAKSLESGVDISIHIGRKVTPYLNVGSIQSKGIELESILFRISKIYRVETKGDAK